MGTEVYTDKVLLSGATHPALLSDHFSSTVLGSGLVLEETAVHTPQGSGPCHPPKTTEEIH